MIASPLTIQVAYLHDSISYLENGMWLFHFHEVSVGINTWLAPNSIQNILATLIIDKWHCFLVQFSQLEYKFNGRRPVDFSVCFSFFPPQISRTVSAHSRRGAGLGGVTMGSSFRVLVCLSDFSLHPMPLLCLTSQQAQMCPTALVGNEMKLWYKALPSPHEEPPSPPAQRSQGEHKVRREGICVC